MICKPLLLVLPLLVACARATAPTAGAGAADYFPAPGAGWQHREPAAAGFDAAWLAEAVAFAQTQETTQMMPNFSTQEELFGKLLGPMPTSRAATNGLVLRHGYLVAEWGNTQRPDPTYSVAKSRPQLRLPLVAQHRATGLARRAGQQLRRPRRGPEYHLG